MMAHGVLPSPPTQPRRVKVYELKNNDWFDRGTGYCTGHLQDEIPHIQVKSEDENERLLLETKIIKEDGYQKQQETLIVWTEPNGTDMALSFQEPEGCAAIWEFVNHVQGLNAANADEMLSDGADDALVDSVMLPPPDLGNLPDIEMMIRTAGHSPDGRNSLGKFILSDGYIEKLIPLLQVAEDLESLDDLHRLCNITKAIILLNDTVIIEHIVTDGVIMGIVGMLEYDPDFPTHKANHRQYLSDPTKFKEVVRIENPDIRKKIHWIYRLQYLKDVILARILDDPTFSVLNSLIFYHQVEVLQWIQSTSSFLKELFGIFSPDSTADVSKKRDAVLFVQHCCQIAKNIQAPSRQPLYQTFIQHGLFMMIDYSMKCETASVRVSGMDIIMAMIDHDQQMMRSFVFKQLSEGEKPITDTLIELLQAEKDFGVKAQVSDAIKILLDPQTVPQVDYPAGDRRKASTTTTNRFFSLDPATEKHFKDFYDDSAKKLFTPLMELDKRESVKDLTVSEVSLYVHLLEILWFFVRQHVFRSKLFIITEDLPVKIVRLLENPEKHLKLAVVKLMRILIQLRDSHFEKYLTKKNLFEPVLDLVIETMPRDNLLNSACLEFFEYIKRENIRQYVMHLYESHRAKLEKITYVDTFANIINRAEQWVDRQPPMLPSTGPPEERSRSAQGSPPNHLVNGGGRRWQGVKDLDPAEDDYFNTSDDEDEIEIPVTTTANRRRSLPAGTKLGQRPAPLQTQGTASPSKPLVDYPDDDEAMEGTNDTPATAATQETDAPSNKPASPPISPTLAEAIEQPLPTTPTTPTPERLTEKRRRTEDDDDDDELGRLMTRGGSSFGGSNKKRSTSPSSSSSFSSTITGSKNGSSTSTSTITVDATTTTSSEQQQPGRLSLLRKRSSLTSFKAGGGTGAGEGPPTKKIAISLGGIGKKGRELGGVGVSVTATPTPVAADVVIPSEGEVESHGMSEVKDVEIGGIARLETKEGNGNEGGNGEKAADDGGGGDGDDGGGLTGAEENGNGNGNGNGKEGSPVVDIVGQGQETGKHEVAQKDVVVQEVEGEVAAAKQEAAAEAKDS